MSLVWTMSQRIKDQDIQAFQQAHTFWRNLVGIGAVSHVTKAKTQHLEIGTMLETNRYDGQPQHLERFQPNALKNKLGNGTGMSGLAIGKGIVERLSNTILHRFFTKQRDSVPQVKLEQAEVIQAENMVRVLMREQDTVHDTDTFSKQLAAQIGRRID